MPQKTYSSQTLDAIRQRIDALDRNIHDALMERAELVLQIGEEKRKNNIQIVQPAREARLIRRLLDRHRGPLPEMAVVRIWRELVGAVSMLQTRLTVSVSMEEETGALWDLARDYFGSCLPFQKAGSDLSAIAAVRDSRATFAVVSWPQDSEDQPWWEHLADDPDVVMRVIVRLPHGDDSSSPEPDHKALVVSKGGFDSAGEDRSFLLLRCITSVSRARVVDTAKAAGFEPVSLASKKAGGQNDPGLHFLEVDGYVSETDPRLQNFREILEGCETVIAAGGYPVPPVYPKIVQPQVAR